MAYGWYASEGSRIELLFEVLERDYDYGGGRQDDFTIALEDAEGATLATDEWQYGPARDDGLTQLLMKGVG